MVLPTELNIKRLLVDTALLEGGPVVVINYLMVIAGLVSITLNAIRNHAPLAVLAFIGILMAIRGLMCAKFYCGVQNGLWSTFRARRRLQRDVYLFTLAAIVAVVCSFL